MSSFLQFPHLQRIPFFLVFSTFSYYVSPTLLLCHTGIYICIHVLLPTTGKSLSSFWLVQVPYTKSQFQRFRPVHWAVQIRFHSNILPQLHSCPFLPYVLLHCRTAALLLFCSLSTYIQRMIQHQFVFFQHTGRQLANFGSTTNTTINHK